MWTVSLESDDNLISLAQKFQAATETELGLPLKAAFPFTQNLVNLKILRKEAERLGKNLTFLPEDGPSRELVLSLGNGLGGHEKGAFGFVLGRDLSPQLASPKLPAPRFKRIAALLLGLKDALLLRSGSRAPLWGGLAGLLCLGGLLAFFWLRGFWPNTNIALTVSAEDFVRSIDLEASLSAEKTDVKARVIPAVKITAFLKEKGEGQATGVKEVGEKASGAAVIYNKTDREQVLKKGTLLRRVTVEAGKDWAYLTNNDLKVPAREATTTPQPGYVFGKVVAGVTAEKIGDNYNLPSGTTFSVGGFSPEELAARNEEGFTGGKKREVKVVTEADQEKALAGVTLLLKEKLKNDLRSRLVGDQKLNEGVISFSVVKKTYDRSVDEEAERFSLDLEEEATAYVYSQGELQNLLTLVLAELVPTSYELFDRDQSVTVANVYAVKTPADEKRPGSLKFTAKVRGYITPKLDLEKVKKDIAGRTLAEAENYLNSLPGVDSHRITLWPNLPSFQRLPRFKERVEITVERR